MRPIHIAASALLALAISPASAQVKDGHGNALRVGLPAKPAADYDGGTISAGRPAKCVLDGDAPQVCTFYPRNRDGSFAIDVAGLAYYADKVSPSEIIVDYDNGARMVPQGSFTRSKRDPACWVQGSDRKICVY
ncbi:hypothetical protein [Novosphingobium lindaniclasticum]